MSELYLRFFDRGNPTNVVNPSTHLSNNIVIEGLNKAILNYKLLVVLTDDYCSRCIQHEVKNVNKFYQKFPHLIDVKYGCTKNTDLEQLGSIFPYDKINSSSKFVKYQTDLTPPYVVLLDSLKTIHSVYRTEFNNYRKSDLFFERMIYLFNSIREK